jgi:hypothetical protein
MDKLSDRLVIIGCADLNEEVPYADSAYEKWILGFKIWDLYKKEMVPPLNNTRIFEIHTIETRPVEYMDFLRGLDFEVIMQELGNVKRPIKYPLTEILDKYNTNYHLCSFTYMIALAMFLDYKEIHFYGVNMVLDDDYLQKYNMEYWLGRAEQSGIKLFFSEECDLLKCGALYGYEAVNTLAVYQNKYRFEIRNKMLRELRAMQNYINNILERYIPILNNEQNKFMKEIIDRHKLNWDPMTDEAWDEEEC